VIIFGESGPESGIESVSNAIQAAETMIHPRSRSVHALEGKWFGTGSHRKCLIWPVEHSLAKVEIASSGLGSSFMESKTCEYGCVPAST
jgi:hypothetical protein